MVKPAPKLTEAHLNAFIANAIKTGDEASVRKMLREHPPLANHPKWTPPPLHCATLWDQPAIAELLLDHLADIELLDPDRQTTPLRYAVKYCRVNLIALFLFRGAVSGPIINGGLSALEVAMERSKGDYSEFQDLPSAADYANVIEVLQTNGITT